MRFVPEVEQNIPLPGKGMVIVHICEREPTESNIVIRKFRSKCGNTLEVHITRRSGYIRSIKPLDVCQAHCLDCLERTKLIRELIAREYCNLTR